MAPPARTYQTKRPTPAEQAEGFKQAQEQMKADAARRRAEAEQSAKTEKPRRRT